MTVVTRYLDEPWLATSSELSVDVAPVAGWYLVGDAPRWELVLAAGLGDLGQRQVMRYHWPDPLAGEIRLGQHIHALRAETGSTDHPPGTPVRGPLEPVIRPALAEPGRPVVSVLVLP